jgi:hypothetical protein
MSVALRSRALVAAVGVVGLGASCATTPSTTPTTQTPAAASVIAGFATPESVLFDAAHDMYLVSNINGSPSGVDDNGFISKLSPTGDIIALKWIDGAADDVTLNAPKGSAIVGDTLYVADISAIRMFDVNTGKQTGSVDVPGATFLNDVAASGTSIIVTDTGVMFDGAGFQPTGADAIYVLDTATKALTTMAKGREALPAAKGVVVVEGTPWVVYFGAPRVEHFDAAGASVQRFDLPAGSLDGIVDDGNGGFFVSSWESSSVYRVARDRTSSVVKAELKAPADIGFDAGRKRLLVPHFMDNTVEFVAVP